MSREMRQLLADLAACQSACTALQSKAGVTEQELNDKLAEVNTIKAKINVQKAIDEGKTFDANGVEVQPNSDINTPAPHSDATSTVEYRKAFMDFCRTGARSAVLKFNSLDAMTTTADAAAVIPSTILTEVIRSLKSYGQLYARVRKLAIKGGVTVPISTVIPVASWITEAATSSKQKVDMSTSVSFSYFGLECKISTSLLADATTLDIFEKTVIELIGEAIAKALDTAIVSGAGTTQPMKDRVVQYPARYKLTPVSGTTDTFDLEAVPGVVTEAGTDLNKAALMKDATAALYGLTSAAVPDDVLAMIPSEIEEAFAQTLKPQIIVTVVSGSTVTATLGTYVANGVETSEGSGVYICEVNTYGTYTVEATLSGNTESTTVSVTEVKQYEISISYPLSLFTWEQISAISKAGNASSYWEAGDTKDITINSVTYTAKIIGFDHDTPTDTASYGRSKAGITFELSAVLPSYYTMYGSNSNAQGWTGSTMRTSHLPTLLSQLNSDLSGVLVFVNKLTSAGSQSTTINTTSDKLFILSEIEVFGAVTYSVTGEGSQYDYYLAGNDKGAGGRRWTRSPAASSTTNYCDIQAAGYNGTNYANTAQVIMLAFCV